LPNLLENKIMAVVTAAKEFDFIYPPENHIRRLFLSEADDTEDFDMA